MREHGASVDGRSKVVGARRSRAQLRLEDGPQDVQRRLAFAAERRSDLLVEYGIVNLICLSQLTEMAMRIRFPIKWTDDDDIPRTNMRP